jgi:hypothetical protein
MILSKEISRNQRNPLHGVPSIFDLDIVLNRAEWTQTSSHGVLPAPREIGQSPGPPSGEFIPIMTQQMSAGPL